MPLDHLMIAARTLDEGAAYVRERLGVEVLPGGRHETMGTHNRVLSLGGGVYLEVIAIDCTGRFAPTMIQWPGTPPGAALPDSGLRPEALAIGDPRGLVYVGALRALGYSGPTLEPGTRPGLALRFSGGSVLE